MTITVTSKWIVDMKKWFHCTCICNLSSWLL